MSEAFEAVSNSAENSLSVLMHAKLWGRKGGSVRRLVELAQNLPPNPFPIPV